MDSVSRRCQSANPEAERIFGGDVFALKVVVDKFMPQFSVAFVEIERQFATGLYRANARTSKMYGTI